MSKTSEITELKEYNQLAKEINEIYHKISVREGLSDSAFLILYAYSELNLRCQKDIAKQFSISKQTINSSIKKLEKDGILTLETNSGRNTQICLTEQGEKFVKEKILSIVELEKMTLIDMGEKDRKELIRITDKYAKIFKHKVEKYYETR